jgi:hypothetical protein
MGCWFFAGRMAIAPLGRVAGGADVGEAGEGAATASTNRCREYTLWKVRTGEGRAGAGAVGVVEGQLAAFGWSGEEGLHMAM